MKLSAIFAPIISLALAFILAVMIPTNNPLRPFEACGTSGMKAALNGALNLSILDGWWDEWYDGENGWEIPTAAGVGPYGAAHGGVADGGPHRQRFLGEHDGVAAPGHQRAQGCEQGGAVDHSFAFARLMRCARRWAMASMAACWFSSNAGRMKGWAWCLTVPNSRKAP